MDDRAACETFVREAYAGLFRWFCRLSGSADRAADLTQETFAAFWASPRRGRVDVSPRTWLYAIGRNQWRKHMRDRKQHPPLPDDTDAGRGWAPETIAASREFQQAAEAAVAALPDDLREAFTLRFWHAFDYEEIAVIQGTNSGLARWRYFAARKRLHEALAAWDPDREPAEEDRHAR